MLTKSDPGSALLAVAQANQLASRLGVLSGRARRLSSLRPGSKPQTPVKAAPASGEKSLEEIEDRRREKYWEKWALVAAKQLLATTKEDQPSRELLYSARVGDEPRLRRSDSCESLDTNLSLFNTSSGRPEVSFLTRGQPRKADTPPDPDTNGRDGHGQLQRSIGALTQLMRRPSGAVTSSGSYRRSPVRGYGIRRDFSEMLSDEERNILYQCGLRKGLTLPYGIKSESTENLLSFIPEHKRRKLLRSIHGISYANEHGLADMGRTPSPSHIAEQQPDRPKSACHALVPPPVGYRADSPASIPGRCGLSGETQETYPLSHAVRHRHSIRSLAGSSDVEGKMSRRVGARLKHTLEALDRLTGYGDGLDTCRSVDDEPVVYTATDYSRIAKYPQLVRVAPELSRTIRKDIRKRMGRPRCHEIRVKDIKCFDSDAPKLDRFHKNLFIFNWLNEVHESEYEYSLIPPIYDLDNEELVRPDTRSLLFPAVDSPGLEHYETPSVQFTKSDTVVSHLAREDSGYLEEDEECSHIQDSDFDTKNNFTIQPPQIIITES